MASKHLQLILEAKAQLEQLQQANTQLKQLQETVSGFRTAVVGSEIFQGLGKVVSVVESAWSKIRESQKSILEQGRSAQAAGADVEGYSRLLFAAGGDAEMLNKALFHLSEGVGAATLSGGEGAKAFERLGIDLDALGRLSSDKQFLVVAEALKKIENQSLRNRTAMDIFGKSAKDAMALINLGREGIDKKAALGKERGMIVTSDDVAAVKSADLAMQQLDTSIEGVWRRVSVQLSPAIQRTAMDLEQMKISGASLGDVLGMGANEAGMQQLFALENLLDGLGRIDEGGPLAFFTGGKSDLEKRVETFNAMAAAMAKAKQQAKEQSDQLKKTADDERKLAQDKKTAEDADRAQQKLREEMQRDANKLLAEARTSYEKLADEVANVNSLQKAGFLTLEQQDKILQHIGDQTLKNFHEAKDNKGASLAEGGTAEAYEATARFQREAERESESSRATANNTRKIDENTRKMAERLARIGVAKF